MSAAISAANPKLNLLSSGNIFTTLIQGTGISSLVGSAVLDFDGKKFVFNVTVRNTSLPATFAVMQATSIYSIDGDTGFTPPTTSQITPGLGTLEISISSSATTTVTVWVDP